MYRPIYFAMYVHDYIISYILLFAFRIIFFPLAARNSLVRVLVETSLFLYVISAVLYRCLVTSGSSSSTLQIWDIGGEDSGKIYVHVVNYKWD